MNGRRWLALGLGLVVSMLLARLVPAQTPLQLVGASPQPDAVDVLIDSPIQLQFSAPLDPEFEELTLSLMPAVPLAFDTVGDQLILEPTENLAFSTDYTLSVPSQAAIPLAADIELKFRTEPQFTYDRDVKPLLEASCVGCHQPAGRFRQWPLHDYAAVMAYVEAGSDSSALLNPRWAQRHSTVAGITDFRRPGGSPELAYIQQRGTPLDRLGVWTAEEVNLVRTWIVQDQAVEATTAPAR